MLREGLPLNLAVLPLGPKSVAVGGRSLIFSELIDSARQGSPKAIATLLSATLDAEAPIDIQVKRCGDRAIVTLRGPVLPNQSDGAQSIYVTLAYLAVPGIKRVQIQAVSSGRSEMAWIQQGPLQALPLANPLVPLKPTGRLASVLPQLPGLHLSGLKRTPKLRPGTVCSLFALVGLLSGGTSALYVQQLAHQAQLDRVANAQLNRQPLPTPPPAQPAVTYPAAVPAVVINAVGDIIPGTDYPGYRMPQDPDYLFRSIQPFLRKEADILFGNFESTMTDHPHSAKDTSRGSTFAFRTPPSYADVIKSAGFDVMSVANNHSFDFGQQGFEDTITHLESSGIQATGRKGQITYLQANGQQVAFIAFSIFNQHNSIHDLPTAEALIRQADEQADIIVVSVHAGSEGTNAARTRDRTEYYLGENRGNLVQFSRAAIDYGADLVLGHGPHVVRAVDLYQNRLIAYSLGNFLGHKTLSNQAALGVSMILQVGLDPEGAFVNGRIIPVALDPNGVPYLDDYFQGVILARRLTQADFPMSPLVIDDLGYIRPSSFIE